MTKDELAKIINNNVYKQMDIRKESLKSEIEAVIDSITNNSNPTESLFEFYASAAQTGALAAVKTLFDLKILEISE